LARPAIQRLHDLARGTTGLKLTNLAYAAIGYTLGARAGRERYEDIVRIGRRVAGSQTVQSTAGVVGGQLDQYAKRLIGPSRRRPGAGSPTGR
jgi:hypothetical protein